MLHAIKLDDAGPTCWLRLNKALGYTTDLTNAVSGQNSNTKLWKSIKREYQ